MKFFFISIFLIVQILSASCGGTAANQIPPANAAAKTITPETFATPKTDAELQKQIEAIAAEAKGKVGVYATVIETGETVSLKGDGRFAMQSVYKVPIAMAVLWQVRHGKLKLDETVRVEKADFVTPGQRSPIRDKYPNGTELTLRELIRLSISESDGTASDVQLRLLGGAAAVQEYLTGIGITDIKVVNTEKEFAQNWQTQYANWATPAAAVELLRGMNSWTAIEGEGLILQGYMIDSPTGPKRLKGLLPKGTFVMHKTGTSGSREGVTAATNDIGIIPLPNGKNVVIAVFVSDSSESEQVREAVIAKIAKAVWDKWGK
ncbi:MAG: class A beta-lactamase [Saprospiraceae bacterium]|nr:class A beta-lactamase [Pyrinomonadaceae bacterium]